MRDFRAATLALLLLSWTTGILAYFGIDDNAKAAYFIFQPDGTTEYVFALNAAANGDVFFHMSGPKTHSWLGVGIGSEMKNSFMIIAYPSSNGLNTTISPRLGTGHKEPSYNPSIEIVKIYNDTYAPNANTVTEHGTGTIISHALCKNCSSWATGFLDTRSKTQPFIFALGPNKTFGSDSLEASIPRHEFRGKFTMDMTQATNYTGWYGRVPAPNVPDFKFPPSDTDFANAGASAVFDDVTVSNHMPGVHAALMCVTFLLIFPVGALVMQFLKRALWHAAVQVIGFVAVFAAFGVVIPIARQYNKVCTTRIPAIVRRRLTCPQSKNFNSAHQVIGLLILAGLLLQVGLGLVGHSTYVRTNQSSPFSKIHFFLGPFIMVLGLINAGVGFNFAGNSHLNILYAIIVVVVVVVFVAIIGCQLFCRSRRKYKPDQTEGFQHPTFEQQGYSDYEMPRQPTFGEQPPEPYEPTTPYTPTGPYSARGPYSPITPSYAQPFTPLSAYTPVTPKTWKKEEITNWPQAPWKEYDE